MLQKGVFDAVIAKLKYENCPHKIEDTEFWHQYLSNRRLPFSARDLREVFDVIFKDEKMTPSGKKLLCKRRSTEFTVKRNNKAGRPEEALERFIVVSNDEINICNQFPIGGGKESVDLAILNNSGRHEFVELKPWKSSDSPIYAVIELLKNHYEYGIIRDSDKISHHESFTCFNEVDLILLAPRAYYEKYKMINKTTGLPEGDNLHLFKDTLNELGTEFKSRILIMVLCWGLERFEEKCDEVCRKYRKDTGNEKIRIQKDDFIPDLLREGWILLVSSEGYLADVREVICP